MGKTYDLLIIGTGPAGLTASIYAKRAGLNFLCFANPYSLGSQICNTYEVCNYPGFNGIAGPELHNKFLDHAKALGVDIKNEKVESIADFDKDIKKVKTKSGIYETKNIVLCTGAYPKKGGFEREDEFVGSGVSYCATCDGAFYKDKVTAVIGGGDVAVEDAILLSKTCTKVYLIVRKNYMRATKALQDEILSLKNVEILFETVVKAVIGEDKFEGLLIKRNDDIIASELTVDGVFVGIGTNPDSDLLKDMVLMENGLIVADETCKTSVKGIYACGDVRKKQLQQVITACSDGANAITSILKN